MLQINATAAKVVVYEYKWILVYVAFCTIMAISRQKEARSRYYALLLFRMTKIRPDRDSNLVPPGYKPQSIRMSGSSSGSCPAKISDVFPMLAYDWTSVVDGGPRLRQHLKLWVAVETHNFK